jgi:hypothetical protein
MIHRSSTHYGPVCTCGNNGSMTTHWSLFSQKRLLMFALHFRSANHVRRDYVNWVQTLV